MNADHAMFADWDAAYVLGALTPADRRVFEEHLQGCDACKLAVAELAPMPGLLALARPVLDAERGDGADASPPADLMERIALRDRERRRVSARRVGIAAIGVAAAAALAVVVPAVITARSAPQPAATVAMSAVGDAPLTAVVDLTPVPWGTSISMNCEYPAGQDWSGEDGVWVYALVVTDEAGAESQVGTWTAAPGRTVTLDAATAMSLEDIASIEVRSPSGKVILSADVEE